EASREETRRIDLAELVGEVTSEFELAGHEVTLAAPSAVPFEGRPVALKRALRNVVENAVRYGGGARAIITDTPEAVEIAIEDDGPGLPGDRLEEAFQPFVRLEPSRSRETGGLGLGLSIARGIVQSHGGTIALANRECGGLRVEIRLPRPRV
ncbi:MAG: two-component sensor histidine kinase, partial [Phyllobacteriaceae bacterium]|nr:two-component sensor histidine kinase [Phyllobacteriaceae bacterium]